MSDNVRVRLAIRGFADGNRQFEEFVDIDASEAVSVLPSLAEKHAQAMNANELHMIEIEFLDEANPNERFFRFGTDPAGMVMPIRVDIGESDAG